MIDKSLLRDSANLQDIQNNYVTGGPGDKYVNSVLDKYMTPKSSTPSPTFGVANTPLGSLPSGPRFPYYYPSLDIAGNEELYAQGQGWFDKAFNATTKGLGLAGTTFINGTVGLLTGTTNAVADGKFSSFYNNEFSRSLDDFNKMMEDQFPNYYTQAEQNAAWYSPTNLFTANFLFDKVIKNMGYAAGALLSGASYSAALRSLGLFTKIASAGGLARAAAATEDAIALPGAWQRSAAMEGGLKAIAKDFIGSYNTLNKAQRAVVAGLGTLGEASFEALQSANDFRTRLIQEYITKNAVQPDNETMKRINEMADGVGNTTFGLNVALLSATNYIQFPKILGSSYRAERKLFTDSIEEVGNIVEKGGKYVAGPTTRVGKALYKAQNLAGLLFSPSEAFEEGSQTAIQYGVNNYFDKAYKGKDADIFSDLFGEGIKHSLTSKEGIESILIGGISGGLMEARGAVKERGFTGTGGERGANTQAAVDAFNRTMFSGFVRDTTNSVNRGTILQQQRAEAIRRGDFQEARDLEYDYAHNYLTPRIKYGRFDLVIDDIEKYRQLSSTNEGWDQLVQEGVVDNDTSPQAFRKRLDNFESHAKNTALMYQSLNTRYGGVLDEDGNKVYTPEVIDKMVYAASKVSDYDERIHPLANSIMASGISVHPILDSLMAQDLPSAAATRDALSQIDNLDILSEDKETMRDSLRDIVEMGLRRKAFMKEYDRIKKRPSTFQEQEMVPTDVSSVPIPQQVDKQIKNRNFELGKQYNVEQPFIKEGNRLTVLPTLTMHERNALGEVRTTMPTGETNFVLPEDLSAYQLRETPPFDKDLAEKAFSTSLENVLSRNGITIPTGTLQEKLNQLDTPENADIIDRIYDAFMRDWEELEKIQKEIDNLRKNEKRLKELNDVFNQIVKEAGTVSTGDPNLDITLIQISLAEEGRKKPSAWLFSSTTSPDTSTGSTENADFHKRANKFLNYFSGYKNADEFKVIFVTQNNQDALGLKGLIKGDETVDEATIRAVFIRSTPSGDFFVNEDGDNIGKVGDSPEFSNLVYSTMPNTSINWRTGGPRYITVGPNAITEQQAVALADAWRKQREVILSERGYTPRNFSISGGIPRIEKDVKNPVSHSLVRKEDLDSQIIVIPTQTSSPGSKTGLVEVSTGEFRTYPVGRPILIKDGKSVYLNNRKLTDNEKNIVKKALTEFAKNPTNQGISSYLKGLLYWGRPQGTPNSNQIWYDNGLLYLGGFDDYIPFVPQSLENSKELNKFLNNAWTNVNNFLLNNRKGTFNEIIDIKDDGELVQVEWKSYQHYLLSDTYDTTQYDSSGLDGQPREDIPLTTNVVAVDTSDPYWAPFDQVYAKIDGIDLSSSLPETPKVTTPSALVPPTITQTDTTDEEYVPITQAGSFVLDGETLNPIERDGVHIMSVAATWTEEGPSITHVEWNIPEELYSNEQIAEVFVQLAISQMSQAVLDEANRLISNKETAPELNSAPPSTPEDLKPDAPDAGNRFRNLRPPAAGDSNYRAYRTSSPFEVEDIEAFTEWMNKNLPSIPVHTVNNLIEMTGDGYAWGVFQNNAIYIYDNAEIGTGYHEAFEAVYNAFLTNKEQAAILKEFKARKGSFVDRETGNTIDYSSSSDHQAKEQIAEEFRDYRLNGTNYAPKQTSFFRRLIDFIVDAIFGGKIKSLFKKIGQGYFANKPVIQRDVAAQPRIAGFNIKFVRDMMEGMTVRIFQELFKDSKNIVAFDESNPLSKEVYDNLYNKLNQLFTNDLPFYLNQALEEDRKTKFSKLSEKEWNDRVKKEWAGFDKFFDETWGTVSQRWDEFVREHKDFLKPFSIIFTNDSDSNEVNDKENDINSDDKNFREYGRDILRIDAKKSASTSVKLLFATLTDVEPATNPEELLNVGGSPREKLSSLELPTTVKYSSVFNKFLHEVANTNGLDNIMKKLRKLAGKDQRFIRLYNRIRGGKYQALSINDWKLLMKLYTVASKQKPDYMIQITDDAGNTYTQNANDNTQTRQLVRKWLNNMKASARNGKLVFIKDGVYRVNVDQVRTYNPRELSDRLRFVSDIGFTFSKQMYDNLSSYDKGKFNKASNSLHAQLLKSGEIGAITNRALGISAAMNKLAEVAVVSTGEDSNSQHFNIDGEPVQNFILGNYVSTILNDINAYETKDQLLEALPHLKDTFSSDSLLLQRDGIIFDKDGNRREESLKVVITEGSTKASGSRSKGTATANLNIADRRMQEFNQNLNGSYYVLLPADSKTEWGLRLGHFVDWSSFDNKGALANRINTTFRNYLKTEILLAQDHENRSHITNLAKTGDKLRFFKDILSEGLINSLEPVIKSGSSPEEWIKENQDRIQSDINEWIKNRVDAQIDNFKEYRIITKHKDTGEKFYFSGLDSEFVQAADLPKYLTEQQLRDVVRFRTVNYVIANMELHKVFFGDPAEYKDATKRIKSFLSGRESTYHTDPYFDQFANESMNYAGEVRLAPSDPGYHAFKDYMNTVTVRDINVVGSIAINDSLTADQIDPASKDRIYGDTNEADAQSWASVQAYREMLLKAGGRWTDHQERQFQYEMAYERSKRASRKDKWKYTYPEDGALKNHDDQLLEQGSPGAEFYTIKPIGTGIKLGSTFLDAFLDKTSTAPLFYRLAEGRQMEEVYLQMNDQNISYAIAISGRKVGAEGLHSLYNPDGSINTEPFNNNIRVPFKYWGIQVETGSHKDKQTRGSQLTKLAIIDLISRGVPVDVEKELQQWIDTPNEDKMRESKIWNLVQKNKAILEAMSNRGYSEILRRLNIVETDEGFKIPDYQSIVDYINKEITRRELPENVREAVSVNPATGEFTIPLEALNNYKTLKNIIYSIVDKQLLSPKVSGGPKVQVSSTLFETNKRQAVYRKDNKWVTVEDYNSLSEEEKKTVRLTSADLKFYTPEEPWIEVYVPHWFKHAIEEKIAKNPSIPHHTDEEILKYINAHGSELLRAIGFRIPTQALSSIENIRIKGFLPQEFGNNIVVPSEITSKAGSDFDIDKLNTYLRNFKINREGYPVYIRPHQFDESYDFMLTEKGVKQAYDTFFGNLRDFIDNVYDQLDELRYREEDPEVESSVNSLIDNIFGEITQSSELQELGIDNEKFSKLVEKYIPFSKFQQITEGKTTFDVVGMFDPKALENAYYENLEQLLSLPQNFKRLIQPNSAKELEDLRDELLAAQGRQKSDVKGNYSVLLDPMFMSQVRHNFISGKGGVGIAAVQQTNNALNQAAILVVNHRNWRQKLTPLEQSMMHDAEVRLPHNIIEMQGERFISLSHIVDKIGTYISDKISSYINGFVDVAKDAFIIELGADLNVASTYMFLEKIGVPTKDVIFFMNQPIIREYLKVLQIEGLKWINTWTAQKRADDVRAMFPAKGPRTGNIDVSRLKGNIERYRDQQTGEYKLTEADNAEQLQILDEFFKYYVMSSHLFKVTQGSNYDTANFNEPALVYKKLKSTENARNNSIIGSVDKILNSSFIGNVADKLIKVKGALGTIFKLDTPSVASVIESVIDPYISPDKFLSERDFLGIATKIQSSFIDWVTQTLGEGRINSRINAVLMDMNTSVANQLYSIKRDLPQDSDILQNPVLKILESSYDNSFSSEVKIITLTEKAYDAYTSNYFTDAFRELRENPHTQELYHDLIYATLLQSGIRKTTISYTDLIPVEDYSPIIARIMQNLDSTPGIGDFADLHAFERNNWSDDQIVPIVKIRKFYDQYDPEMYYEPVYDVPSALTKLPGASGSSFIKLHSMFDSRLLGYPVVKVTRTRVNPYTDQEYTKSEQEAMRKRGDFSFQTYRLYTPIYVTKADGDRQPLTRPDTQRPGHYYVMFKQINAWGSPGKVQEYYNTGEKSVLPANVKVKEFTDAEILAALDTKVTEQKAIEQQNNEQRFQDDYIEYEEVAEQPIGQPVTRATIQMQEKNINKILSGIKTTTIRSAKQAESIGIPTGSSAIVNFGGRDFSVTNRGLLTIQEAGGKEAMLKSEGVSNESEFAYQQTKDWVNGKGRLFVYNVTPYFEDINIEEVKKNLLDSGDATTTEC